MHVRCPIVCLMSPQVLEPALYNFENEPLVWRKSSNFRGLPSPPVKSESVLDNGVLKYQHSLQVEQVRFEFFFYTSVSEIRLDDDDAATELQLDVCDNWPVVEKQECKCHQLGLRFSVGTRHKRRRSCKRWCVWRCKQIIPNEHSNLSREKYQNLMFIKYNQLMAKTPRLRLYE